MRASVVYLVATMAALSVSGSADSVMRHVQPDTDFIAIDMVKVSLPEASAKGFEPSPFIVWYDRITDRRLTWIMTLDGATGAQLGERLEMYLPPDHIPVDILWSTHFLSSPVRGTVPSPFIICEDYFLYTFPVSYGSDGTPMADEPTYFFLPVEPEVYGYATCLSEMAGSEFIDGNPRLYLGTEFGFIVALVETPETDIVVDEVIPISDSPVIDLEPIPQYEYISLGVLTNNTIYGIDPEPGLSKRETNSRQSPIYTLSDPRPTTLTDIEVFGVTDQPLTDPDDMVHLVVADGTNDLALTEITAMESGSEILTVRLYPAPYPCSQIASGSLLMLEANGSGVFYDPGYSEVGGPSSCQVEITDEVNDSCNYLCGDCNGDGRVTVADATYIVSYIYRQGPAPLGQGDVNLDTRVTIADATYLVAYIYRGGPAPCQPPIGYVAYSNEEAEVAVVEPITQKGVVNMPVAARFELPIAGVHLEVTYDSAALEPLMPEVAGQIEGFEVFCKPDLQKGRLKLGMLSLKGHLIEPGDGPVLMLRFKPLGKDFDVSSIKIKEAILVDQQSRELMTSIVYRSLPRTFSLGQNFPNPFRSETTIRYALPGNARRTTHVCLKVYDSAGRLVTTVVNEEKEPGYHAAEWNCRDQCGTKVAAGVYFYRLEAGDLSSTKKMVVVR